MVPVQQRLLIAFRKGILPTLVLAVLLRAAEPSARRFFPDDPLWCEPAPVSAGKLKAREIDDLYDFVDSTFIRPREEQREKRTSHRARNVNTLGEVPDSAWYTNRHGLHRMSIEALVRGPGNSSPPDPSAPWQVIAAKSNGVMPGFTIKDSKGRRYLVKFDPPRYPELASAADVIGSKFFYALGYNTPENYVIRFRRDQLAVPPNATWRNSAGHKQRLTGQVISDMLASQPRDANGYYRAMASRFIDGSIIGPFRYSGVRTDDPNDVVPHQDRRELRGLAVFAAWLNHTDVKSINSLDTVVEESGVHAIKHYLIDFGSALGSDGVAPKDPRLGHEYFVDLKPTGAQMLSLGLYVPRWSRANFPKLTGVGNLESRAFDPVRWKTNYPNPAFLLMDDEDAFWAAKQVMAFRDDEIRAMVKTGQFTDPGASDWIARCLIERRDKIGNAWLTRVLPLDHFRVEDGKLAFTDLAAESGIRPAAPFRVRWAAFDNGRNTHTPITQVQGVGVAEALGAAPEAKYLAACIEPGSEQRPRNIVVVYLRRSESGAVVVGVDHSSAPPF